MTRPLSGPQSAEEKAGPFQQTLVQDGARGSRLLKFVFKTIRQDLEIGN